MNERPPPDSPQAWLRRARSDLALGQVASRVPEALPEDACFHAQQCAEKALKALLVHKKKPFPRTHVLEYLLDLLKEAVLQYRLRLMRPFNSPSTRSRPAIRVSGNPSHRRRLELL
jgi:HEPN domain-containing protein